MKWFIASDIHGSAYYCRLLTERFVEEQADRILLLGDLLYHGPRNDLPRDYNPKLVASLLNEYASSIFCVAGNCEAPVDQMMLSFPIMASYCLLSIGERCVFATHGDHFHAECMPPLHPGDILLHGHTHIPGYDKKEDCLILNPGSVSIPKEGSVHSYMLLDENGFSWKDLEKPVFAQPYLQLK